MPDNPQLVFGHFRVAAHADGSPVELGRGAMGVTYKAFDERLRIDVALKLITPAQIDNPKAQTSFLREARAAARVHHSNVASVVFLNDTPGNFFYAMEFVEGQPMREWMRAHPSLPPLTVIGLAIQIARGLEAIHEQEIVHRDLKPTNLMMVRASRTAGAGHLRETDPDAWKVKIIDFGLARAVSAGPGAATQTAGFHGTALYASPEQCEERADLDGRSDLYSLGCIMWEMLCGAPPFHARTHRELLNQHVSEPLPMDRLAHVPPSLAAVVARMLIKDPANRFPNAAALIKALENCRQKLESGEEVVEEQAATTIDPAGFRTSEPARPASSALPLPAPGSTTGGSRRDLWIVAVAVLALVVPFLIFIMRGPSPPARTITAPTGAAGAPTVTTAARKFPLKSVAVLPFTNLSSTMGNESFANGIQDGVLTKLTKLGDLRVTSRASVLRYLGEKDLKIAEIARELGVESVVEGSVHRDGDRVLISVQLIEADTGQKIWAQEYDRELDDISSVQSEIALAIASALQANLAPAERAEVNRPIKANLAALEKYFKGRGLMSNLGDLRNLDAAAAEFEAAVQADPNFALAYAQLSLANSQIYQWRDQTPQRREYARLAAEKAQALEEDLPEAQLALGQFYYRCLRDYAQALPHLQRALVALPGDAEAIYALASVERRQGRWEDAAQNFKVAAAAAPSDPVYQFNAVTTLICLRRYEEAWQILEPVLRRMPAVPPLELSKGDLFLAWKGDLRPMREFLNGPNTAMPDLVLTYKMSLLLLESKFDEALAALRSSDFKLESGQVRYRTRAGWETEILTQAGRREEAKTAGARAVLELAPLAAQQPRDARIRMAYALALASTRDSADQAVREAKAAASLVSVEKDAFDGPIYLQELALVYLRTGHLTEAAEIVSRLQKIPSLCYDTIFRISPAWATLRADQAPEKSNTP